MGQVWSIYYESVDIIRGLEQLPHSGEAAAMHPTVMRASEALYEDSQLGGPFSTTALALRIGNSVMMPLAS